MLDNIQKSGGLSGKTFLRIRHEALNRAAMEIRRERFNLDDMFDRGKISEDAYKTSLVKLIIRGNNIKREREEIERRLNM